MVYNIAAVNKMLQRLKRNPYKFYPDMRNYCSDTLQLNSKNSFLFCTEVVFICDMCYIAKILECTSWNCGFSL